MTFLLLSSSKIIIYTGILPFIWYL
jgi:hypothetical protein